jgi:hypothetical protein
MVLWKVTSIFTFVTIGLTILNAALRATLAVLDSPRTVTPTVQFDAWQSAA